MNNSQLNSIAERELSKLLDFAVAIHVGTAIADYNIITSEENEVDGFEFIFKDTTALVKFTMLFGILVNDAQLIPYRMHSVKNKIQILYPS